MAETVTLCETDELAPGEARRFDVAGHRIALVRIGDDFHALDDECSHEDYSLSEGEVWVDECQIECPRHGSTFDLLHGRALLTARHPSRGRLRRRGRRRHRLGRAAVTAAGADPAAHVLEVRNLHASAGGREVLHGIDLTVRSGEVHVIMGPNGSGKSTLAHALMGRPGTEVTDGQILMDGSDITGLPAWQRARAGLFLALQHPLEVPGVGLHSLLAAALADTAGGAGGAGTGGADVLDARMAEEAKAVGLETRLLSRPLNVDLSGGEKKRTEMVQLGVLHPAICVLDEVDSGLDVDALGEVARRLQQATTEWDVGLLAITHFNRFLVQLEADLVYVMVGGRIVATGDAALALRTRTDGLCRVCRHARPNLTRWPGSYDLLRTRDVRNASHAHE